MQDDRGFRPHTAKAFIPLSEEFRNRHAQGCRAVMVEVIGRANLGHRPHDTIADDMAIRFGGYTSDFLVAGYRDRNYVIFLPLWVRPETLLTIDLLRLQHCRLKCYPWEPLRTAGRSRLSLKVWIRLLKLPFECWTEDRVSAMVCGFARFLKADEQSLAFDDLSGFKCSIAVDAIVDIPEFLSVSMGDYTVTVPIRIEGTAPFGGDDHGIPLAGGGSDEGADQTDPAGRPLARRIAFSEEAGGDSDSRDGCRSGESATWNSSELRDRRRSLNGGVAGGTSIGGSGDPLLGPPDLGLTSKRDPPTIDATRRCLVKEPGLAWDGPRGPLEVSANGAEAIMPDDVGGVQRSSPLFNFSGEEGYDGDSVTVANLGALGFRCGSGLDGLSEEGGLLGLGNEGGGDSTIYDGKGGLLGPGEEGGVDFKVSGGAPWRTLASGPLVLPEGGASGLAAIGLDPVVRPPLLKEMERLLGLDWAFTLKCFGSGRACIVRQSGPVWAFSMSGPTASLSLLGRNEDQTGPSPLLAHQLWVRAEGGRLGGTGADPGGGAVCLGGAGAVVVVGEVCTGGSTEGVDGGGGQALLGDEADGAVAGERRLAVAVSQGAASTKQESSAGLRKSSRLASSRGGHALTRAMSRKAAQRDEAPRTTPGLGGGDALALGAPALATTSAFWNICELGAKCGVLLSDVEAASLESFLQDASATV